MGLFMVVPALLWRAFSKRLGLARYVILWSMFGLMMLVPVKIVLRIFFHIKYFLITPWFKI
jgi:hypothetical protein